MIDAADFSNRKVHFGNNNDSDNDSTGGSSGGGSTGVPAVATQQAVLAAVRLELLQLIL